MKINASKVLYYILLTFLGILFVFPLFWMISSSLKPEAAIYNDMGTIKSFLPSMHISEWLLSYQEVFRRFDIWRYMLNSVLYAGSVTIGSIVINALAGFSFAKFNFKGKKILFLLMLFLLVVPGETIIISKFVVAQKLGILNTSLAVILPLLASPLFIYMFSNFFKAIPEDIIESAKLEGANDWQIFWKIMLPMSKPAIATVGTLAFLGSWNDYIWPLMVLTDSEAFPLQVAITNINNTQPVYTNQVMSILTISTIPLILIYVFFQKYLIQGLGSSGTGVK